MWQVKLEDAQHPNAPAAGLGQLNMEGHGNPSWSTPFDDAEAFELAPVALMLEDLSQLNVLFQGWRAEGVTDLAAFLLEDPRRVAQCTQSVRVIKMNRQMLDLFDISYAGELQALLGRLFPLGKNSPYIEQLAQFWHGNLSFMVMSSHRDGQGRQVDLRAQGNILPGHEADWARVLIAFEDVSREEQALRHATVAEAYARSLFEQSPIALLVNDFTEIKRMLDEVRASGVTDFYAHAAAHPDLIMQCLHAIKFMDVNQQTLALFEVPSKEVFFQSIREILPDDVLPNFVQQLGSLWEGKLCHAAEVVSYTLTGKQVNILLHSSIMAGYEDSWELILVAQIDITARKKAESHLEFISQHDIMTGLYNRTFFMEEIARLERLAEPVTIFMIDLDGLKQANDRLGHAAGDELLMRAGRVLEQAADKPFCAARVGGDEFALIVPRAGEADAARITQRIETLIRVDNQGREAGLLSLSVGSATCAGSSCLEDTIRQADLQMYEAKRRFYATRPSLSRRAG